MNIRPQHAVVAILVAVLAAAGCENPFEPEPSPVPGPESHVLHDFRAGPLTEPSAFDLFSATPSRTDQTSSWDFLFYVTSGGELQFHPRDLVVEDGSTAGLRELEESFADLLQVPETDYVTDAPVPVLEGAVYAARSRRSSGCTRYAKLAVDSVDVEEGRLFMTSVVNPNCNDLSVEPEVDEDDEGDGDDQGDEGS